MISRIYLNSRLRDHAKYQKPWQTVFNLEISQNGSYVPHGILNWVISVMVWVLGQTMIILNNWRQQTDFSSSFTVIPSPSSFFSGSTANFFSLKNKLSFCCRFIMKQKQQNKTNKWSMSRSAKQQMQNVKMYVPAVSPGIAWNTWPKNYLYAGSLKWQSFHTLILLKLVISPILQNFLLLLPATLEVLLHVSGNFFLGG